jgi:Tropinone reductase 1
MVARDADALEQARADLEEEFPGPEDAVLALPADVTDEEQRNEILDWATDLGGLHLLVNNAGGNVTRPVLDYGEDQWRGIFEVNLFAAFELCRGAYPLLSKHPSSAIVNIGSVSGIAHVRSGAPYGMSKAALHQMTRNLAVEWAEDGVRANTSSR